MANRRLSRLREFFQQDGVRDAWRPVYTLQGTFVVGYERRLHSHAGGRINPPWDQAVIPSEVFPSRFPLPHLITGIGFGLEEYRRFSGTLTELRAKVSGLSRGKVICAYFIKDFEIVHPAPGELWLLQHGMADGRHWSMHTAFCVSEQRVITANANSMRGRAGYPALGRKLAALDPDVMLRHQSQILRTAR